MCQRRFTLNDWNDPFDFRSLDRSQQGCCIWVSLSYEMVNIVVPVYITWKKSEICNRLRSIALNDGSLVCYTLFVVSNLCFACFASQTPGLSRTIPSENGSKRVMFLVPKCFEAQLVSLSWLARMIVGSQIDSSSSFSLLNSHKAAMRDKPLQLRRLC